MLSPGCSCAWAPKVVRAAQGAHFVLNIVESCDLDAFLRRFSGASVALSGAAPESLYDVDLRGPLAIVVGNEGQGLSAGLQGLAGRRARIPMPGKAESLNAAVAGAVALFEAVRQRR